MKASEVSLEEWCRYWGDWADRQLNAAPQAPAQAAEGRTGGATDPSPADAAPISFAAGETGK